MVVLAAALALNACQTEETSSPRDDTATYSNAIDVVGTYIVDYCTYGAVSIKQLSGCLFHVSTDEIEALDTSAASYAATGQGGAECGPDAGPFCGSGEAQDRALRKALSLK